MNMFCKLIWGATKEATGIKKAPSGVIRVEGVFEIGGDEIIIARITAQIMKLYLIM